MANSALQGQSYSLTDTEKDLAVYEHLKAVQQQYANHPEYYKWKERLEGLIESGSVTYEVLKRIKHDFAEAEEGSLQFEMMGGAVMRDWVSNKLREIRNQEHQSNKLAADTAAPQTKDLYAPEAHTSDSINRATKDAADAAKSILNPSSDTGLNEQIYKMKQLIKTL